MNWKRNFLRNNLSTLVLKISMKRKWQLWNLKVTMTLWLLTRNSRSSKTKLTIFTKKIFNSKRKPPNRIAKLLKFPGKTRNSKEPSHKEPNNSKSSIQNSINSNRIYRPWEKAWRLLYRKSSTKKIHINKKLSMLSKLQRIWSKSTLCLNSVLGKSNNFCSKYSLSFIISNLLIKSKKTFNSTPCDKSFFQPKKKFKNFSNLKNPSTLW